MGSITFLYWNIFEIFWILELATFGLCFLMFPVSEVFDSQSLQLFYHLWALLPSCTQTFLNSWVLSNFGNFWSSCSSAQVDFTTFGFLDLWILRALYFRFSDGHKFSVSSLSSQCIWYNTFIRFHTYIFDIVSKRTHVPNIVRTSPVPYCLYWVTHVSGHLRGTIWSPL